MFCPQLVPCSALLARFTQPGEEGNVYGLDNAIVAGARAMAGLWFRWWVLSPFGLNCAPSSF
ncbi:MAG: hypothetical protein GY805_12955 [Chloroflexi bacterium]|nr:hypothetical protein [Chloroflexota bacterium]